MQSIPRCLHYARRAELLHSSIPFLSRNIQTSAALCSAGAPGPIEKKARSDFAKYEPPAEIDPSVLLPSPNGQKQYSAKIKKLAHDITHLTLLEIVDLTDILKHSLNLTPG